MEMREKDIDPSGFGRNLGSKSTNAGSGVEDEHRPVLAAYFDSGRVSAIATRLDSWSGQ